eukprot:1814240-Amphidinium_carterae.1
MPSETLGCLRLRLFVFGGSSKSIPDLFFKLAQDRYHLYVALACPWACGALAAVFVKGLAPCLRYPKRRKMLGRVQEYSRM